jgi:hypothetical protein
MISWNPLVNKKFSLDGEITYKDGFIQIITFESGKERHLLKNTFIPRIFPSLSLVLNNKQILKNGKTEYEEFIDWYERSVRYGTLSFVSDKINVKNKPKPWYIKNLEKGIYKFTSELIKPDKITGLVAVSFGLEEIGVIPEQEHVFLKADDGKILLTDEGRFIVV